MTTHLIRKLGQFTRLSAPERQALERVAGERVRSQQHRRL
jgi:hypothetical protein